MKVEIDDSSPDGLTVTFKDGFYFDTYEEAFEFIRRVDLLEHEIEAKVKEREHEIAKAAQKAAKGAIVP